MLRRTILFIIGFPIFGCLLGWLIVSIIASDKLTAWRSLGTPPYPAISFASTTLQPIVLTQEGILYAYEGCGEDCWIPIDETSQDLLSSPPFENCPEVSPPHLDKVVAEGTTCDAYGPLIYTIRYAITENGNVWKWEMSRTGLYHPFVQFLFPVVGSIIFLGLGILGIFTSAFESLLDRLDRNAKARLSKADDVIED